MRQTSALKHPLRYRLSVATLLLIVLCHLSFRVFAGENDNTSWVATWASAQQLVEDRNMPPAPGLEGNTLKQVIQVSAGGEQLRLRLSNFFGNDVLHVKNVKLYDASHPGTQASTLLFDQRTAVSIPAGEFRYSDALSRPLAPMQRLIIELDVVKMPSALTGHPGSRTTSYILPASSPDRVIETDHWYLISAIEVATVDKKALAILGDSITDGRGSGTNQQNRWPDILAARVQAQPTPYSHVAVMNMGIGGNCVLQFCLGESALDRLERDVLTRENVRWLIVFEGINDIGQSSDPEHTAKALIEAYQAIIQRAHAKGIIVYGATLLPFKDSFYYNDARERARGMVNHWIRQSGTFDAVLDFEAVLEDPKRAGYLLPEADTGDHLHPNEHGYALLGSSVPLSLFTPPLPKP